MTSRRQTAVMHITMRGFGVSRRGHRASASFLTSGFSIAELLIVVAIIATLAAIAIPLYFRALENARIVRAVSDVTTISLKISNYLAANERYPQALADIGEDQRRDPWGRPYQYLFVRGLKGKGAVRKDKNLVPINSDYDLYSLGKDGLSLPALTAKVSKDDIIRANDGAFIGLAVNY